MIFNPWKGRYETVDFVITNENTTWFNNCTALGDIHMITDWEGSLLIKEFGYSYAVLIYDTTRTDLGHSQLKAFKILQMTI